jgi:hypothetical protein
MVMDAILRVIHFAMDFFLSWTKLVRIDHCTHHVGHTTDVLSAIVKNPAPRLAVVQSQGMCRLTTDMGHGSRRHPNMCQIDRTVGKRTTAALEEVEVTGFVQSAFRMV